MGLRRSSTLGYRWGMSALGLVVAAACARGPRAVPSPVRAASAANPQQSLPGQPGDVAFLDVAVIPMDRERVLRNQTVVVQQGRITAIGPERRVRVPAGATRVDGRGEYLIPGLADCHAHLSVGSYHDVMGDGPAFRHAYDTLAAKHKLFFYLANGVTTLRNVDYIVLNDRMLDGKHLLQLRAEAASGELWSPRIYTSGAWTPDVHTVKPESVATALAAYQAAGYDFVKVHDESPEVFDSLAAAARRLKLRVLGHLTVEQALRLGPGTSIEHDWWYLDRRLPVDSSDTATAHWRSTLLARATAMQRAGIWNCPTIRGDTGKYEGVKVLLDAGVGLLLGTDLPAAPYRHDKLDPQAVPGDAELLRLGDEGIVHEELVDLVRAGLTPYQALATGTKNVAAYFGTLDSSGTVAVGKRADLVLLSGNPL